MSNTKYGTPISLPDGHRLFPTLTRSAWYIADESGWTPETTDDGPLALDFKRPLQVDAIPLVREDGEQTRTPTNTRTVLILAATFDWPIRAGDTDYTVRQR